MEQLTEQLDLSAAAALADQALERHVWKHETGPSDPNAGRVVPATSPSPPPDDPQAAQPEPRLLATNTPLKKESQPPFEYLALRHFGRKPDSPYYNRYVARPEGSERFEFAQPLRLEERCAKCHVALENGHNILVQLGEN